MKKTLAEILAESREQAQKTVDVIDKLIAESKEAGIEWPELEDEPNPDDYKLIRGKPGSCSGCAFHKGGGCAVMGNGDFYCLPPFSGIYVKKQPEDE